MVKRVPSGSGPRVLIVVPTLNEERHIGQLMRYLMPNARRITARIVVADGGSEDATRAIVQRLAAGNEGIILMDNPDRIQSAGINLAVARHGTGLDWLIRIDAHSRYPADYCNVLLEEAAATGADSVVVGMLAEGHGFWQEAIAAAQNSRFGNGGAGHRTAPRGRFVKHGHHALMRLASFRAVGGYDGSFSHNEDAELDLRLSKAGFRIWLTERTRVTYFPRNTVAGVVRQYLAFGKGRARNALRHRRGLRLRHGALVMIAPAMSLAVLAPLHSLFMLPMGLWIAACAAAGGIIARSAGVLRGMPAGFIAGAMQIAWSAGFWMQLAASLRKPFWAAVDFPKRNA
jgi:succinoglycan biosynthesis protein ExoA